MDERTIFISYRHSDTTGIAGRLAETLENILGAGCVFRDADDIPPGEDFDAVLTSELANVRAVIVLIGRKWLSEMGARLALSEPDYVRIEIATALRLGKRIIPILLDGAELPAAASLPVELQPLVRHQALSMREEAWNQDAGRLADAIGRPYPWHKVAIRAALFLPATLLATKYGIVALAPEAADQIDLARAVVLGLFSVYIAVEAALWWQYRRRRKTIGIRAKG